MFQIVDLRGTSGSGKSSIVKQFLTIHPSEVVLNDSRRIMGYRVDLEGKPLYLVGRYTSPTGGCDTIPDMDLVIERINFFAQMGNVLYEGLRTSGVMGRLGANSKQYGDRYLFAFLDTPLETCKANVDKRRAARGAAPLTDHKHTVSKYNAIFNVRRRIEREGQRTLTVAYGRGYEQLREVFLEP